MLIFLFYGEMLFIWFIESVIFQALASCSYFQSFLQKILDEYESSPVEGQGENLPLTITLSALLEGIMRTM